MSQNKERRPLGVGGPVIHDMQRKIGTLQRRATWLDECITRYNALSKEEREKKSTRNRFDFDREEREALAVAIEALSYHRRELDGEAHASHLLIDLVDAVRDTEAAKTTEAHAAARAKLEEAMQHAGPHVDDERTGAGEG